MLKVLGVSRSGYRAFLKRKLSATAKRKNSIREEILKIHSDFSSELHNILKEQFNPEWSNAVWCTDITYVWTNDGFVYLNCVMDLFARRIIAWTLADTMEVSTVIKTIEKAKAICNTDLPLIIHTDRGSQYVSQAWREATKNMQRSYSHKGYPYDNACFFFQFPNCCYQSVFALQSRASSCNFPFTTMMFA